jgi:hypothetical protein
MEIKVFGKSLFEFNAKKGEMAVMQAYESLKAPESKYLPDFESFSAGRDSGIAIAEFINVPQGAITAYGKDVKKDESKKKDKTELTPKNVYQMQLLHKKAFKMNTNPEYVTKQLEDFKDKLNLIKSEEWDVRRGVEEVSSIVVRLENRKKYSTVKDFFEQFPYTTTSRIGGVIKSHDYLKLGKVAEFLADMPKEAMTIMKEYNTYTKEVCEKQAVFYVVANKKDFERTQKRRDPILLAQSPFGHFWQLLGAWDNEMLLLEDL